MTVLYASLDAKTLPVWIGDISLLVTQATSPLSAHREICSNDPFFFCLAVVMDWQGCSLSTQCRTQSSARIRCSHTQQFHSSVNLPTCPAVASNEPQNRRAEVRKILNWHNSRDRKMSEGNPLSGLKNLTIDDSGSVRLLGQEEFDKSIQLSEAARDFVTSTFPSLAPLAGFCRISPIWGK